MPLPAAPREVPQWVLDHFARPFTDIDRTLGTGLVLMRDGVVIDRYDFKKRHDALADDYNRLEDWRWEQEAREGKRGLIVNLTAQ